MTWEMAIIAVVRVLGSLPVLRWPFIGAIVAILVDFSDLFMMNLIHLGGVKDYQSFDKYLDQVYMLTFLAVAMRWQGWERSVAVALYAFRLAGFITFEATGARDVLLFFPNFFEAWFLLIAGAHFFRVEPERSRGLFVAAGASLAGLKIFQEYALHEARWLDNITAVDAVKNIWEFVTAPFR